MKNSTHSVIGELNQLIAFVNSLDVVSKKIFFSPIYEGKWSPAAIIAHFMYWDRYILEERFEGMMNGELLQKSNMNVDNMNRLAKEYAHSGINKVQLIQEVCKTRQRLFDLLVDRNLGITFKIGSNEMTVNEYFKGMVEHDNHHIKQIMEFLKLVGNKI
ncbi:DinB superfamily protein [Bacillus sp. 491mf]|uniref:DinB family protein n=1 Tax=Bacillus sp. 491mf TaxID=1761755 RepID=UPI0008F43341|nr:DinB family protein [Bacillus sp. 491mf]SFC59013.1 DinB superfamily protein [Bacillus sp. 491mf]